MKLNFYTPVLVHQNLFSGRANYDSGLGPRNSWLGYNSRWAISGLVQNAGEAIAVRQAGVAGSRNKIRILRRRMLNRSQKIRTSSHAARRIVQIKTRTRSKRSAGGWSVRE